MTPTPAFSARVAAHQAWVRLDIIILRSGAIYDIESFLMLGDGATVTATATRCWKYSYETLRDLTTLQQ